MKTLLTLVLFAYLSYAQYPVSDSGCNAGNTLPSTYVNGSANIGNSCGLTAVSGTYPAALSAQFFPDVLAYCGVCYRLSGPLGSITANIVDLCAAGNTNGTCYNGAPLMLGPDAFAKIGKQTSDTIQYQQVTCPISGPIQWVLQSGSSEWWFAVQVRNSLYAIDKLEARFGGNSTWYSLYRQNYNYWTCNSNNANQGTCLNMPIAAPVSLRATANGQVIEDDNALPQTDAWPRPTTTNGDTVFSGHVQFSLPTVSPKSSYCDGTPVPKPGDTPTTFGTDSNGTNTIGVTDGATDMSGTFGFTDGVTDGRNSTDGTDFVDLTDLIPLNGTFFGSDPNDTSSLNMTLVIGGATDPASPASTLLPVASLLMAVVAACL